MHDAPDELERAASPPRRLIGVRLREGGRADDYLVEDLALHVGDHCLVEVPSGHGAAVAATVHSVTYLGDHCEVWLEMAGGTRILATVRGETRLQPGESVPVRLPPEALLEVGWPAVSPAHPCHE